LHPIAVFKSIGIRLIYFCTADDYKYNHDGAVI